MSETGTYWRGNKGRDGGRGSSEVDEAFGSTAWLAGRPMGQTDSVLRLKAQGWMGKVEGGKGEREGEQK